MNLTAPTYFKRQCKNNFVLSEVNDLRKNFKILNFGVGALQTRYNTYCYQIIPQAFIS